MQTDTGTNPKKLFTDYLTEYENKPVTITAYKQDTASGTINVDYFYANGQTKAATITALELFGFVYGKMKSAGK